MSAGASTDHSHAAGAASATLPLALLAAYAALVHKGEHAVGAGHGEAEKPVSRLTAILNASRAPQDVRDQLDELLGLAERGDRHDIVAGSAQALFSRLKACLPDTVTKPERRKRPGLWGMIVDAISPLPMPPKDAKGVLKRALKQHWITQSCCDMADGLPLELPGKVTGSEQGRTLARFLALLAEQIYADKRAKP